MATCPDVAPECGSIEIVDHEHHVAQSITRSEIAVQYGLRPRTQLTLRVPWDRRDVDVRYATLTGAPFAPPYGDIHHRSESLHGFSDASLTAEWLLRPNWILGGGATLPIGRIEPNPIELGRRGVEHQHLQFGSGTFQPKLSVQWLRPARVAWSARGEVRASFYENREGYRAPTTIVWSVGPSWPVRRTTVDLQLNGQHQSLGRWDGEIDEGTGFRNGGLRATVAVPAAAFTIQPAVYRELWSQGMHDETFRQRTTWSLALSRAF